jgi:hypothetical protein
MLTSAFNCGLSPKAYPQPVATQLVSAGLPRGRLRLRAPDRDLPQARLPLLPPSSRGDHSSSSGNFAASVGTVWLTVHVVRDAVQLQTGNTRHSVVDWIWKRPWETAARIAGLR